MQIYNYTTFHNLRADEGSVTFTRADGSFMHLYIKPEFKDVETALEETDQLSYVLIDVGHMIPKPAGRFIIPWSGKWRYEGIYFCESELKLIDEQIWFGLDLWN